MGPVGCSVRAFEHVTCLFLRFPMSSLCFVQDCVEMMNYEDCECVVSRAATSDFDPGECWGYNCCFRIDRLVSLVLLGFASC